MVPSALDERQRTRRSSVAQALRDFLRFAELAIYNILALMLAITAFASLASAAQLLWKGLEQWTIASEALRVLDQLLIVLMLVEILHTVRISIRSHILLAGEPFLVVGLIASIRRILIISLQMASLTREATWSGEGGEHLSCFDAGAGVAGGARAGLGVFDHSVAPLCSRTERSERQHGVKAVQATARLARHSRTFQSA